VQCGDAARELLASLFERFSEGHGSADLQRARALLERGASPPAAY